MPYKNQPVGTSLVTQGSGAHVQSSSLAPEEFLTTHELMKLLKIKHRQTIYGLIEDGMPVIAVGRNYRFMKEEVIQFLKGKSKSRTQANHQGNGTDKL